MGKNPVWNSGFGGCSKILFLVLVKWAIKKQAKLQILKKCPGWWENPSGSLDETEVNHKATQGGTNDM